LAVFDTIGLGIDQATGHLICQLSNQVTSPATVLDGAWHCAVLTWSGTTLTGYLDGASIGTSAVGGTPTPASALTVGERLTGSVAHVAWYTTALSAARVATISQAALTGFATDRADQRLARLAGYAGIGVGDQSFETGQQPSMAAQGTSGSSVL